MIDIEEAISTATQQGGICTITGRHGEPIAHVVTERRMRGLLSKMSPKTQAARPKEQPKRKPTRGERRAKARRRALHAADIERSRKQQVTARDNANRDRKLRATKHKGTADAFSEVISGSVGDRHFQHDLNKQVFGDRLVVPTTRR